MQIFLCRHNCRSQVEFEEFTKEQFDILVEFENQKTSCKRFRLDIIHAATACTECLWSQAQPDLCWDLVYIWMLHGYNDLRWERNLSFFKDLYLQQPNHGPSYCSIKGIYRIPYLLSNSYAMITWMLVKLTTLAKFTFQAMSIYLQW